MLWPIFTVLIGVGSIFLALHTHPHPVSPADPIVPVPEPLDSGPWAPDFPSNKELGDHGGFMAKGKIQFAETVFVKKSANCDEVFATDSRGRVWALALAEQENQDPQIVAHVGGTLLGGAFDKYGGMYLADSTRGLLYIAPEDFGLPGKARIMASLAPSKLENAVGEMALDAAEIRYANDIAVNDVTGHVYFTDSSRIAPSVDTTRRGDTLLSYGSSHLTGDASGRLLVYVPSSGETHVLVNGIPFANGVGIAKDRTHVVFASSSTYSLRKFPTVGANFTGAGTVVQFRDTERFYVGTLAGTPDGLTVDEEDGSVFVPIFGPVPCILRISDASPSWLRRILVSVPAFLRPKPTIVYTFVAHFNSDGILQRVFHDTKRQFGLLSSVDRCGKYLFCGSLKGNHAARFDLTL